MRQEIAEKVHPVLRKGLDLLGRLGRGESPDFPLEQAALKELLLSESASRGWRDFGSDSSENSATSSRLGSAPSRRSGDAFLGVRYALACWLDEIFIVDSRWDAQWNEHKIEEALYRTNDRAWTFWEQAKLAEARQGTDALEVFYLCVMLGFRGDLRDDPDKLKQWADVAGRRIAQQQGRDWPMPPELEPATNVPPLHGRERLQRMALVAAGFVLVLIPLLALFIVVKLLSR
jgi:type VI secretion system protein ImpK